jgi:DHA2 family multidrug resistance protein
VPLTTLALGAVNEDEVASAAGVMNFLRTMSGAVGTAIGVTMWQNEAQAVRSQLTDVMHGTSATMQTLQERGFGVEQSRAFVSHMVDAQATAISTVQMFAMCAVIFVGAATIIWLAPKPKHAVDLGAAH